MAEIVNPAPATQSGPDYEALFDQQLAEMRRLNEQMDRTAQDTRRFRDEMSRLKAEGALIEAETRAILSRLEAAVENYVGKNL